MTQAANLAALGTNAGTTGILPAAGGGTGTASGVTGFKNRIINGDMTIAQRSVGPVSNATASSTLLYDTLDRWGYWAQSSGVFTTQQSSAAPAGFNNSALITSSTALSVGAGTYYSFAQRIEGFNFADLGFGTANAKTFTVSFWVRSSITGTFPFYCFNSGYSRSYASTFTINAVNTWEQKTITVVGDTTGTWLTTNGIGIEVGITLAAGSNWFSPSANTWSSTNFGLGLSGATNFLATNGATMNITGFQLEIGSAATNFDYLPYGTELQLCQRYYIQPASTIYAMLFRGDNYQMSTYQYPVTMRATPTSTYTWNADTGVGAGTPTITPYIWWVTTSGTNLSYINPNVTALKLSAEL